MGRNAPAARAGRSVGALIMVVLLVMIGLVAADRITHGYAEKRVAAEVTDGLGLAEKPDVDINGVPFLTQLAGGTFSDVRISADELDVRDSEEDPILTLDTVRARLTDVRASDGYRTLVAGGFQGSARADWDEISRVADVRASFDGTDDQGRGRVRLVHSTRVLGQQLSVDISGRPVLESEKLTFAEIEIDVGGIEVPQRVADELIGRLMSPIPLPLPLGLRTERLTVDETGAALEISGEDVPLAHE